MTLAAIYGTALQLHTKLSCNGNVLSRLVFNASSVLFDGAAIHVLTWLSYTGSGGAVIERNQFAMVLVSLAISPI